MELVNEYLIHKGLSRKLAFENILSKRLF